jgi:type II secretion system protein G
MMRLARLTFTVVLLCLPMTGTAIGADLSKTFPSDTMVYVSWPGQHRLSKTWKGTTFHDLMSESEMVRLRQSCEKDIWPALRELIHQDAGTESDAAAFDLVSTLMTTAWRFPCAFGLIGVGMAEAGPQVDLACVIRAGDNAGELLKVVDDLMTQLGQESDLAPKDIECNGIKMRELIPARNGPPMPMRWGVIGQDVIWTLGTGYCDHQGTGPNGDELSSNPEFIEASKLTGASADTPAIFVNIQSIFTAIKSFQTLLAASGVPVLGAENGVQKLLDGLGLSDFQSLTIAMAPTGEGVKTTTFLHAPNLKKGLGSLLVQKPLTEDDLAVVPKNVTWATVANFNLKDAYNQVITSVNTVAPSAAIAIKGIEGMFQAMTEISFVNDVLGAFKDTWAIYNSDDNGGFWVLGTVLVAEVHDQNRLTELITKGIKMIPPDDEFEVSLQHETYRDIVIHYVNFRGLPIPVAPAWAQTGDRFVAALYPQVVRVALNHLLNKGESITANEDFQRASKQMPGNPHSISYVDTRTGVSQIYPLVLLAADALGAMAQGEGVPIKPTLMPSLPTVKKHLFGNVSASAVTPDGLLCVSYGASPIAMPAMGEGGVMAPAMVSILLPSLARARALAKRSVSASNTATIATACLVHAEQHGGVLPPDIETLVNEGLISTEVLIAPQDESGAACSYIYVKGQKHTMDPRNVLVYERNDLNGGEGVNVAFLDGHVKWLTMSQFQEQLAITKERLAKTGVDVETSPSARPGSVTDAEIKVTRVLVSPRGAFASALDLFKLSVGRYPHDLKELVEKPAEQDEADKWHGPYVRSLDSLKDVWGQKLRYRCPGDVNKDGYDLWSIGPDGQDGTDDDIGNWKEE